MTFLIKTIYRICDQRNGGTLINGVTKKDCFLNYVDVFGPYGLTVVADNVKQETLNLIKSFTDDIHMMSLGNSKSFLYALDLAVNNYIDTDTIYLVEDDYLHLKDARKIIEEGIERADYVSLYDHPDKYMDPSPNPLVCQGAEETRVILTKSTHWKFTNSTTMTFASKAKTLREDDQVLRQFCVTERPLDFQMFCALGRLGKKIITPIPGRSTHCDHFPSPFILQRR